jgi:hypothetical protein
MLPDGPRRPLPASLSGTPGDRRLNRLKLPSCSACGHDDTRVTVRTWRVLYLRCPECAAVWTVPTPGHEEEYGT